MSVLLPDATTVGDMIVEAFREAGVIGVGQSVTAEDTQSGWARLQWMLQSWERQRWKVYHLVTLGVVSTGVQSYSVGPGGVFNTGPGARPDKIEAAFLRQFGSAGPPPSGDFNSDFNADFSGGLGSPGQNPQGNTSGNPVDWPLEILTSMEDYSRLTLKQLSSWTQAVFYDTGWPLGNLYPWPVPQSGQYGIFIVVKAQLPASFPTLATRLNLPYEYYEAILTNLAMKLRGFKGVSSWPGDDLPQRAQQALRVLQGANTQISRLTMPAQLTRPMLYNIFSDRNY